jgi:hypothetical protein
MPLLLLILLIINVRTYAVTSEEFSQIKKLAERGNPAAQGLLGNCYDEGDGVDKNRAEAIKWYIKSAEKGDPRAQVIVGDCYTKGSDGLPQSGKEAIKLYIKASAQGFGFASARLANIYKYGWFGTPVDYVESYAYFDICSDFKEAKFVADRDSLLIKMSPEQIEAGKKRSKELKEEIELNQMDSGAIGAAKSFKGKSK